MKSFSTSQSQSLRQKLNWLHDNLVEPPASITDPQQRSLMHMLSVLYMFMLPVVLFLALFNIVTGSPLEVYLALFVGFLVVTIGYTLTRIGQVQIGFLLSVVVGMAIIVIRSAYSEFPHAEIFLLVAVTLGVAIAMPLRYTLLVSIVNIAIVVIFGMVMTDINRGIIQDYVIHMLLMQSLILLFTYNRQKVEGNLAKQQTTSQTRLQLTMSHIPGILWTFDKNLQPTSIAGQGIYIGENEGKAIPGDILPWPLHPDSGNPTSFMQRVLNGESVTYERTTNQGLYQYALQPLVENNVIVGGIGLVIDMSERRRSELQAQQLLAAKERSNAMAKFIQAASHDIKNPLSTINTSLYMMKRDPNSGKQDERISVIEKQIDRLMAILDSFSKMAELERNEYLPTIPTDIVRMLSDLVDNRRHHLKDDSVQLYLDVEGAVPNVQINEETMQRAISNVLDNAITFTPGGGEISVRTYEDRGKVVIEVEDNGLGISESDLPYVFEPFFRGAEHRPIDGGSTGLGLSITKRVIEQHKGRISIASAEGAGTTVRITLPNIVSNVEIGEVTKMPDMSASTVTRRMTALKSI